MKNLRLSTKILLASGLTFGTFFLLVLWFFYQAERGLSEKEMDRLLSAEGLSLSSLVNLDRRGDLDFEFSKDFIPQYQKLKRSSFFRFFLEGSGTVLRESPEAPGADCTSDRPFRFETLAGREYRIHSLVFRAMPEDGPDHRGDNRQGPNLCLVIGTDVAPYGALVTSTLASTLPFLLGSLLVFLLILFQWLKRLTADLSSLSRALETHNFSSSRDFPTLPAASTREVKAVVDQLGRLHQAASQMYRDMILFIARASHQLKTPVTAVQATLEVLLRRDRSRDELLAGLVDVTAGIKQMGRLTQKLISSARLRFDGEIETIPIVLDVFFSDLWAIHSHHAKTRGITLSRYGDKDTAILADDYLLSEIFGNLFENAILYSKPRSSIELSWLESNGLVRIQVLDHGEGFPDEVRKQLFEPFVRGDERLVGGSGLGLSIVKSAVHHLEGSIELIASGPQGSTMQVTLPAP